MRLLVLLLHTTLGAASPTNLYWNTSNPLFLQEQVVVEVNRGNTPGQYDQVNLICPSGRNSSERHIVYAVSREEWEACRVDQEKPRILAICDQPNQFMYFTITFRRFSPSPQQMEFQPGRSYFLVSTAGPGALHSTEGGYCRDHNMRLEFRVADAAAELQAPRPAFWSAYWRTRVPDARDLYDPDPRPKDLYAPGPRPEERGNALRLLSSPAAPAPAAPLLLLLALLCL